MVSWPAVPLLKPFRAGDLVAIVGQEPVMRALLITLKDAVGWPMLQVADCLYWRMKISDS